MPSENATLFTLLFSIGRRLRDEKKKYSVLHFQTLRYVKEKGKPPISAVAHYLCVTRPAATLLIEGLVHDGLLARAADAKDRRTVRLKLTAQGKAFLARGMRHRAKKLAALFSALTKTERREFLRLLEKIERVGGRNASRRAGVE